ncbi:MAG TPA: DUF2203 domain-containing protein [Acidimicrobiales bacterium]|nr:DUF2203 domain-containing protein [Acidimicrobiales bacterium]
MRYWTVEEAQAYLPRLRELVEAVRRAVALTGVARSNGHGRTPGHDPRRALSELEAGDIVVRDPVTGLVDFHARGRDGVVYYLCYRLDEEELGWWHLPEEGFSGRKPLPRDGGS